MTEKTHHQNPNSFSNLEKGKKYRFTAETAAINGSKGGKATAIKMLEEKAFEKAVKIALAQKNPLTGHTYLDDLVYSITKRGIAEGDVKVLAELRKTAGQDPAMKTEDVTDVSDILARARVRSKVAEDEDSGD